MQTVRTVTVCRVLVVPRVAYQTIKTAFPLGTRQMLDNLQAHAEVVGGQPQCVVVNATRAAAWHMADMRRSMC